MVVVPNRKKETLIPIIQKYVKVGTLNISHEWRAYSSLETLGYKHQIVCHKRRFRDPETGAYTNTIEGLWQHLRCTFPRFGTRIRLMHDYHSLFLVKSTFNKTFIQLIKYLCFEKEIEPVQMEEEEEEIVDEDEEIPDMDDVVNEDSDVESDEDFGAGDGASASEYEP
ncbi:putative ISXO2-like transposase domain [Monocercomonoides exilis]|uniref:putative ISXO2-like transposase domain n=1 Tax=Monocercomonoides exilis TaxID=2049356 RepID=UPI00355992E5|nr:putative ISXO2-like transposase domain [Monocercomonoides exilis]|eukprot:MONOS_11540.1-p1 / transcript=MONOS_11540.1 / gene=MONOS_11540 / organism=Monocercomonoides_exilis_PA203 / gene_product=unspecified product / transcript_product=unspecified product / location=Mono_scaffold00584:35338-35841(-) / protein_length=167 / sequence_SO=supercontig / SO=protein_coding / is_pseudo=false